MIENTVSTIKTKTNKVTLIFSIMVIIFVSWGIYATFAASGNTHSISLNGTNQYLNVDSNLQIVDLPNTLNCYVKLKNEITAGSWTIMYQTSGVSPYVGYYIGYEYNGGSRRLKFVRLREGVAADAIYYPITLGTTNWFFLSQTWDGSTLKGYVNAVLSGTPINPTGSGSSSYNDPKLMVGARWDGAGNSAIEYANILFDEPSIFSRALTVSEIAGIYNKTLAGNETGLVWYSNLNNILTDIVGGKNLTNNNSAIFSTDVPFEGTTTTTTTTTTNPIVSNDNECSIIGMTGFTSIAPYATVGKDASGNPYVATFEYGDTLKSTFPIGSKYAGYTRVLITKASSTQISLIFYTGSAYQHALLDITNGTVI